MKKSFNEVIVVEGNHDRSRILQVFPNSEIIITNGSEIPHDTLRLLKALNQTKGLILMLDPDVPGEKIRKTINHFVGKTKHVFLPKAPCVDKTKGKVGIEHASLPLIREALNNHVYESNNHNPIITKKDLMARGLIGAKNATEKRALVSDAYQLGLSNGKTFLKKLNMFNIDLSMIDAVIK